MKTALKPALLLLIGLALLKGSLLGQEAKAITLRVVDENGSPVENARAVISFVMGRDADEHIGLTDRNGVYFARGRPIVGVYLAVSKEGYYPARFDNTRSDELPPGNIIEKRFVLPHVLKPVALYALDFGPGRGHSVNFPVQNEWLGFDFEAGDWVQPYGKGTNSDILFKFKNEFKGYRSSGSMLEQSRELNRNAASTKGEIWTEENFRLTAGNWDAQLDISFPSAKEGMHEEKDRFLPYSTMKMPHEAPADVYVPTWHYTATTYSPSTARDNAGFFLRTRVKLDGKGDIVSANYTKIIGDFRLDARGFMMFASYFNPVPNDRNLEFDPKQNLFPANFPGAKVSDP